MYICIYVYVYVYMYVCICICIYINISTSLCTYMSDFSIVFWGASRFSWLGHRTIPKRFFFSYRFWLPVYPKNRFQTPLMVSNIFDYLILSVWWFQTFSNIIDFHETWSTFIDLCCFLTYFRECFNHQIWVWYLKKWELTQQRFLVLCFFLGFPNILRQPHILDEIMTGSFSGVSATNETWGWVQICCHTRNRPSWTSYFWVPIPKIY